MQLIFKVKLFGIIPSLHRGIKPHGHAGMSWAIFFSFWHHFFKAEVSNWHICNRYIVKISYYKILVRNRYKNSRLYQPWYLNFTKKNIKRLYFLFKKIFCILNWKYLIKSLSRYLILKDDIMIIFATIWEIEEKMITFYSLYENHNYSCPSTLIAFSSNTFCSILIFLFSNVLFITSTVFVLHQKKTWIGQ